MQNEPLSNSSVDMKHAVLMFFVLAALVVSSVNLSLLISQRQNQALDNSTPGKDDAAFVNDSSSNDTVVYTEPAFEEEEFSGLLVNKYDYLLPFGAAEIEAYYTTVENRTSLGDNGPTETCSALVVLNGPDLLMNALSDEMFGVPPTITIGSKDSYWKGINESTKSNPVKLLVTMGAMFEGEAVGCQSWAFDTLTVTE